MTHKVILNIADQQAAERNEIAEQLLGVVFDAVPWGKLVDLGDGRTAEVVKINGRSDDSASRPFYSPELGRWVMIFDFRLKNCDQDHVEITVSVSGGGGAV